MKNIQIVDGALNCTYSVFAADEQDFAAISPGDTNVEFVEDFVERVGEEVAQMVTERLWGRPVDKKLVQGIHGTLFYQLRMEKKKFYPTKKEAEMVPLGTD